jgi:hypothetical protein
MASVLKTSRANRRHQEERVKNRWRRRVKSMRLLAPKEVDHLAVRRAHHNKCDCRLCKLKEPIARDKQRDKLAAREVALVSLRKS